MKLHLGCGGRNFGSDWIHIDGGDYPHLYSHDITNLPFADESVELIYASHVLEYFDREEAEIVLHEWKRVLKDEGVLRIAVPDFEAMADLYTMKEIGLKSFLGPLYGKMKMVSNTIYHKTCYDMFDLTILLQNAGFHGVKRYNWRKTEHAKFDDHSQAYIPKMDKEDGVLISLNMECIK
jgi:predicted SAM-dependent methyltransferase